MFLTGARSNYKLLPKPMAPAPVLSGLRAELMPPGPVSIAMDRGSTASMTRSAARSPMRPNGKQSGSHEKVKKLESTTACPNIFSVKGRQVALTTRPTTKPRYEPILPPVIKGRPSLASKPMRNEDTSRKELCLTDAVSCSNQKICFPSVTKRVIPPIPKSERKVDGPRKRRKVLTIRPTKESRPEQVLPTGKKGRSSLVSVPIKKKEAHPGHVPQPPSATKGKVSHATKPTTKQEAPEVKVSPHINSVTPSNLREEKMKFFKSQFTYNPQFQYSTPDPPSVPPEYRTASGEFLDLAIAIIEKTLKRYGSYERFQDNAGGRPLQEHEIATAVQRHLQKEGCSGEMKVCITKDTLCIASMAIVNGRGMLTINASTARERWLEGTLCHEIGTHYYRSMNNMKQPWWQERKKYGMRPVNPTEEGFATLNTVLLRDQPYLCRAALLYYAAYKASSLSFSELFKDLSAYVKDPDTLWYICMKVKSGLTDTSQPGCNSKCQVYLQGVLQLLRYRQTIDFQLLMALGKISFEDVGRLKSIAVSKGARMPYFLRDKREYMRRLEHIMKVNGITDDALKKLIDS